MSAFTSSTLRRRVESDGMLASLQESELPWSGFLYVNMVMRPAERDK